MSLSSPSRNLCNVFVPGQLVKRCIIHSPFGGSRTTLLARSLYITSQFKASANKIVFHWVVQTHIECASDEPAMTHHLEQRIQNLENPIFTSGFLSLNATNSSWRLHRINCFCLWTPFCMLIESFFTRKLSAVFIILIKIMNKINCFLGHCFTFLLGRLCKYPLSLHQLSCRWN